MTTNTISNTQNGRPFQMALGLAILLYALLLHHAALAFFTAGTPYGLFNFEDYVRFDSYLYMDIAKKGYELFPCWQRFDVYPPGSPDWCGNAGWMPLYPALLRLLTEAGLTEYTAAFALSKTFLILSYLFLFLLLSEQSRLVQFTGMSLAALFPASIYYDAAFPISLMLALSLGCLYWWKRGKTRTAAVCAFFIPLSYSTGFISLLPWGLLTAILYRQKHVQFRHALLIWLALGLGYLSFFVVQKLNMGVWNGFFLVQAKYGHGLHNLLPPLRDMLKSIWISGINHNWQNIQSLLMLLLLIPVWRIRDKDHFTLLLQLIFSTFVLFPLLVGSDQLSLYRSESLLLPAVLLLARKPAIAAILIPVFIYLLAGCTLDFFEWKII